MKPIYLPGHMTVNNIVADFTADTTADAKWYRYGTGTALNTPDPETTNGEFTLFTCGEDSLMVVLSGSISCERRVMPLNVAAANIKIDTILACSAYAWKPTNDHTEILDEPGFYSYSPEGEDCDSTKAIELFFSTPLETTLAKQDACMDSYWSKYGHNIGFLKATVIGGGFSTEHTSTEYTYEWSRANGTIDNESFIAGHPDSLRYLSSDTYYLTTTDINAPLCQAHDTILVDEYSFNYLVTKWGNCVDTDDDVTLGNACYSADVTSHLKTNGDVWNMYSTDCNNIHSLSVTSEDVVESASNCSWKVTRTFTITNGCVTETKTQSVSGGNTTAPTFAAPNNITVFRNLDSTYDIDPAVTGTVSNVSATCSTADTTYQDSAPATNPDGSLTIVRSWTMTDTCQNATTKEQTITVKPASVTVTITGNTASKTYNGSEQSVTGYTVNIPAGTTLTENDIVGPEAVARGTNVTSSYAPAFDVTLLIEQNLAECSRMEFYGHIYDAVRIGIQCWFAENLRRAIGNYKAFGEDDANVEKFGYLYSWYTAMGVPENDNNAVPATQIGYDGEPYVQGICPDGWAVANEADFALLNATAGGTELLKDPGTLYWINGHEGTVPNTGFNARANGHFNSVSQRYEDQLTGSYFWMPGTNTSTFNSAVIQYYCNEGLFSNHPKTDLQGVRCIRKIAQ